MSALQLDPVYLHAAGSGHRLAQSELARSCLTKANLLAKDNPRLAEGYFTAAELFAELACTHGDARDFAVLAGILASRSARLREIDQPRSLEYRAAAEQLFDSVEGADDGEALQLLAFVLDKLADEDPDDDRASARLNRIIGALPADAAQFLKEVSRADRAMRETQEQR